MENSEPFREGHYEETPISKKPQSPEGEVVKEGEKSTIHPKIKEFWAEKGDRIAEFVNVGGWNPTGYGDIREDEDEYLYGRIGLTEEEFIEQVHLISKFSGMLEVIPNSDKQLQWFQDQMEIEWERVENLKQNNSEEE